MERVARYLMIVGVFAYMQSGPIVHQLLGYRAPQGTMTWRMYYRAGIDACDSRFTAVDAEGNATPVDRFDILGHSRFNAPREVKKLPDRKAVERVANKVCRELPTGTELNAWARCGTVNGWAVVLDKKPFCSGRKAP